MLQKCPTFFIPSLVVKGHFQSVEMWIILLLCFTAVYVAWCKNLSLEEGTLVWVLMKDLVKIFILGFWIVKSAHEKWFWRTDVHDLWVSHNLVTISGYWNFMGSLLMIMYDYIHEKILLRSWDCYVKLLAGCIKLPHFADLLKEDARYLNMLSESVFWMALRNLWLPWKLIW